MRRYGQAGTKVTVKGPSAGVKFGLTPIATAVAESPPCRPNPAGLYWFDADSGAFDSLSEAALLERYSDNVPIIPDFVMTKPPYRFHAQLQGDLCLCGGYAVEWRVEWSGSSPPHHSESGGDFFVYPRDDNADEAGVLTVVAVLKKGVETVAVSNDIYLVITSASYYYTVSQGGPVNNIGGWVRVPDNFGNTGYTGSLSWYGGLEGSIGVPANSSLSMTFNISASELWVYSNDGGGGTYIVNNDGNIRHPARGAFSPPWGSGTPIPISGLTSITFISDGYGSPWYVFVK